MSDFVARHDLWAQPQQDAAAEVAERIGKLDVVRFAFSDAHGIVRGKTLVAAEAIGALRRGVTCTLTMLLKDLSGRTAFSIFEPGGDGAGDMVMVADPTTFRVLPWVPNNGWILCDLYRTDGSPHPFSTRALMRRMLGQLAERGLAWRAGLEVEFHLLRCTDAVAAADHIAMPGPPPAVTPLNHGYQYLTELRYDAVEPLLETLRRNLQALGLPLRSLEVEFGPNQVEVTFGATTGMEPADLMLLFRSATKQVFARAGYLASFMCRPHLPHVASSGWHLHHSIEDTATGRNLFPDPEGLSQLARTWLGGLLRNAAAATAFSTPTINGYKRYHAELDGTRSRRVGLRQPRRDGAGRGAARRSGDPAGESGRRAGRQPVSLHGLADRRRSGRRPYAGRSGRGRRYAVPRGCTASATDVAGGDRRAA